MNKLELDNSEFLPAMLEIMNEDDGHFVTIIARGNSMRPFIEDGRDKLVFGKADAIKVGDVILAEVTQGHFVCHRIERIDGEQITMRGDGNVFGTESFTVAEVRAKLIAIKRLGKVYYTDKSKTWKVYSFIWPKLFWCRRVLLALYRLLWLHQLPARFQR
ncbi:MAG: S24/S26 family peptidase [Prevotellaceae bacterium]|nr:S24/S26 family peptidase [Candidatus Minthosoma caballi]